MKDDELVRDMYSHLNLIINELNSIGITKLSDADIVRKIITVLPQKKYASIITILHNLEDLSTMTPAILIGKLVAFEMSRKMGQEDEASSSSKTSALTCHEHKKMKGKKVESSSSSSSSSEEESEEDDEEEEEESSDDWSSSSTSELDEESIKIIKKVEKMIRRLNVKGVPIQIEDCLFTN